MSGAIVHPQIEVGLNFIEFVAYVLHTKKKRRKGKKNSIGNRLEQKTGRCPNKYKQNSYNNYNRRSSNKNSNYYHRMLFTIKSLLGTL